MEQSRLVTLQHKEVQSLQQMQRLMMLPQMQQALHLLQLPVLELAAALQAHLELNPLLMVDSEGEEDEDIERLREENIEEEEGALKEERPLLFSEHDFVRLQRLHQELYGQDGEDRRLRTPEIPCTLTFFEQLMMQIGEMTQDPEQLAIAELLIGNLSPAGYLTTPVEELAATQQIPIEDLRQILGMIQTLEPIGIGASTVQEALLLQLEAREEKSSLAYRILSRCYQELLHNQIPQIQKKLKCTHQEMQAVLEQISRLNLHPGSCYSKEEAQPVAPDVMLRWRGEQFEVEVNEDPLPAMRINLRYLRLLEDPAVAVDVKDFVREKLSATKWLLRTLDQRHRTLYKLTQAVAEKQKEYFLQPTAALLPLTMQAIAEEIGVNASTVVRAVANKYVASPRGLLPLRSLFTHAHQTQGKTISTQAIREALRLLIKKEDKQDPLSDEALAARLQAQGFPCARRTVAKYRAELKEGNVRQRRKY